MNIRAFRREIIEPLKSRYPYVDDLRIESHYSDFWINYLNLQQVVSLPQTQVNLLPKYKRTLCHVRAMYLFASIFFSISLSELEKRKKVVTLNSYLMLNSKLREHSKYKSLLKPYCVDIYRNKLIAHHDIYRKAALMTDANGVTRLRPTPENLEFPDSLTKPLNDIVDSVNIRGIKSEENYYNKAEKLFYHIPLPVTWIKACNRKRINSLVEKVGCLSYSGDELVEIVDRFSRLVFLELPKSVFLKT